MMALLRNGQISPRVTINTFPVETLLEVFDFCRAASMKWVWYYWDKQPWPGRWPGTWRRLIHVCQRWRYVVLSSPLRLDLYLECSDSSPVKELLDVWPPLPIQVTSFNLHHNIIAALEHRDRVSQIRLTLSRLHCEKLATVIQEPLPALTRLDLVRLYGTGDENYPTMPVLPATFLGGSAPRLQSLTLRGVPFPTLPQLLLSCNDLSELTLQNISDPGYISPKAMATGLSSLTRLTYLCIEFDGVFLPDEIIQRPPLLTPAVTAALPTLKEFHFEGFSEYLEHLLARIDVPQLEDFRIVFFRQDVFDIRQVVSHSRMLGPFNHGTEPVKSLSLEIQDDQELGWQVSTMTQIGTRSSDLLSSVTELDILSESSLNADEILMDNSEWLELFHTFSAVRTLRLSGAVQSDIVSSIRELTGESIAEVLPNLQTLYFRYYPRDEFEQQPIELFFAPSDHPDTPQSV